MKSTNKTRNHVQPNRWLCTSQGRRNTSKILKFPKSMLLSFKIAPLGSGVNVSKEVWIFPVDRHPAIRYARNYLTSLCFPTLPVRRVGMHFDRKKGFGWVQLEGCTQWDVTFLGLLRPCRNWQMDLLHRELFYGSLPISPSNVKFKGYIDKRLFC